MKKIFMSILLIFATLSVVSFSQTIRDITVSNAKQTSTNNLVIVCRFGGKPFTCEGFPQGMCGIDFPKSVQEIKPKWVKGMANVGVDSIQIEFNDGLPQKFRFLEIFDDLKLDEDTSKRVGFKDLTILKGQYTVNYRNPTAPIVILSTKTVALSVKSDWSGFWKCWWARDLEGDGKTFTGGCYDKYINSAVKLDQDVKEKSANLILQMRNKIQVLKSNFEREITEIARKSSKSKVENATTIKKPDWSGFWKCWWDRDWEGDGKTFTGGCYDKYVGLVINGSSNEDVNKASVKLFNQSKKMQESYSAKAYKIVGRPIDSINAP